MEFNIYGVLRMEHYEQRLIQKRDAAMAALVIRSSDEVAGRIEFLEHVHGFAHKLRGNPDSKSNEINAGLERYVSWHVLSYGSTHDCRDKGIIKACDLHGNMIETFYDRIIAHTTPYVLPEFVFQPPSEKSGFGPLLALVPANGL